MKQKQQYLTDRNEVIMNMNFDAVVFDMDGVIFDSERAILLCWKEIAQKRGFSNIEETFYKCIGVTNARTKEIVLEDYGQDFPYDEVDSEAMVLFKERYSDGRLPLKQGVNELLEYLKDNKIKIALASSTRREKVLLQLEAAGILKYFEKIVAGDMVERSKPAPDIYLKACEELGVEPQKAYAIEDSRSASAAKLRPIMVPDLLPATEEMVNLCEVVLNNLLEVKEYLKDK